MQRYFYVAKHNLDQPVHFFKKNFHPTCFFITFECRFVMDVFSVI